MSATAADRPAWQKVVCGASVLALLVGVGSLEFLVARGLIVAAAALGALDVVAVAVVCRFLWPGCGVTDAVSFVWIGAVLAFVALNAGLFVTYVITLAVGLCGTGDSVEVKTAAAAAVGYLLVGGWAFLRPRRLVWGWPVVVLVGMAVMLAVQALVPGGHGFCET